MVVTRVVVVRGLERVVRGLVSGVALPRLLGRPVLCGRSREKTGCWMRMAVLRS